LALGWYDYRLHRGIERYAREHSWFLSANFAREKVIPWGWTGDGILAWLGAWDDLAAFVEGENKPTVDFGPRRPQLPFPRVLEDHAHAGRLVGEYFLSREFSGFAFYSDAADWSYDERGRGFITALRKADRSCSWLKWHESSAFCGDRKQWKRKRDWLAVQIKNAPKPLALFAANDTHALDVLEAAEWGGIAVPDEVAVVGAGDYLLAAEAMRTPISTVDTNLQEVGYRGAELLDRLMSGKPPPEEPVRIPAAQLIVRRSSDLLAVRHPGVARSLRFIWERCHEPIGVKDLVGVAGMSRRGLQKAFQDQLGRSPGDELHRVRIERAKRLLGMSAYETGEVARMCGYRSANGFTAAFKQGTGVSPAQFRHEPRH